MSVALIPMFIPQREYVYGGGSSYAVAQQTETLERNHQQVMGVLSEIAKGRIAVTVVAADILPFCHAAESVLSGPAANYDAANGKWERRVSRIRTWQYWRKRRREDQAREDWIVNRAAELLRARKWWNPFAITEPEALNSARDQWHKENYSSFRYSVSDLHRLGRYCKTCPEKPDGYEDLPAIRELRQAASLSPQAVLTVPVDVINKVQRWAA